MKWLKRLATTAKRAPFGTTRLPSTTRAHAEAARALRAWGESRVRLADVARVLGDLVNARVAIQVDRVEPPGVRPSTAEGHVEIVLADGAADGAPRVRIEVEVALAAALSTHGRPPIGAPDHR